MERKNVVKIIIAIISILIVAVLGSVLVNIGMDWFNALEKPTQWITNIVIPIMWTVIYLTFGIVLSIWIVKVGIPRNVIILLVINGLLNILWCLVFFALQLTFIGNIVIVLNLIAGFALFSAIYRTQPLYALLTVIYPIWLSLATTLNTALWILN